MDGHMAAEDNVRNVSCKRLTHPSSSKSRSWTCRCSGPSPYHRRHRDRRAPRCTPPSSTSSRRPTTSQSSSPTPHPTPPTRRSSTRSPPPSHASHSSPPAASSTTTNRPLFLTGADGGAGALVVEATVSSLLSNHLPLTPSPDLEHLHPVVDKATPHVLVLQINRFACGGLVIASSAHHQAADGYSMSLFFHAWADAVRSGAGAAPPLDYLNNHHVDVVPYGPSAITPRRPPRCEFEHRGVEFLPLGAVPRPVPTRVHPSEIANLMLHYTANHVAELKAQAQNRYTTFETLAAHLWRKITVARSRAGDDDYRTALNVTVNGRARLGTDSVPKEFFGNAILTASSGKTSARVLVEECTLADAAAMVRAGVRARDRSWLHLELHRLDFGCGGRLVGILPAHSPLDGVVVLIPSLRKEGGVDVFVALWDKHAEVVRDIAYTMK
ncbi:hypothetical protein HU200_030403 [Digitaria exilis]|uniref:Uncharacterized protein n=1 Tax=Digitaria exilis TaxID=1010633 RepID=A0A835C353_9POAL|nr:hypothetical protein HU200_030403 [Digitaria exilis]